MSTEPVTPWLHVVGVTEQGVDALSGKSRVLLQTARTIIGPQRLLDDLTTAGAQLVAWQSPLENMIEQVLAQRGNSTIVLATGDPNWFGIGVTLLKHIPQAEFALHPAPSAFQLAAARLHWPLQNIATLSLHGRAVESLHPQILPGNRILALTSDASTLRQVAEILIDRKYGGSQLAVLENLGSADEAIQIFAAREADQHTIGNFYVLAIDCVADHGAPLLPSVPGLPDDAFVSDGQLTKRDVRAATLAKLAPVPDALLWDVGAGSGSVAIEWMRGARNARAICFERQTQRCEMIAQNKIALGTPGLEIVQGELPATLEGQPAPDAIFLGGDVDNEDLFSACWQALKNGGRLVANAVTIKGEQALFARQARYGGMLTRIDVSVLDHLGDVRIMRPRMAVLQWDVVKEKSQ